MHYTIIDMEKDPRCGQFAYFRGMTFPFAGLTVEMDITDMMAARGGRPFFLSMLYAVVRAANAVPQLRRRLAEDGTVVEYDWCPPSYTAMKPDGVYVYCTVEGDMPYGTFIAEGQRRQREVLERGTLTEDGDVRSFFFVSSVPWVHYSQLQHPAESPDDSNPRISWGKYVTVNGRTTLPVSLFVNHALADGLHISRFYQKLEEELAEVRRIRGVQRERRRKNSVPVVAIVGYTNAGKSTLLNQLTGAGIPANNRLFDTLDTTSRLLKVSDNLDVILSDTVGFIAKLPHHLVDAFRATLEELEYADLLLHVIDSADPNRQEHIAVVDKLITTLAKPGTPVLYCYNKADLVSREDIPLGENTVAVSAAKGVGMEALLQRIEEMLGHARHHVVLCLPYSMGGQVDALHSGAKVNSVDYTPGGIEIDAVLDDILYGRLREYVTKEI